MKSKLKRWSTKLVAGIFLSVFLLPLTTAKDVFAAERVLKLGHVNSATQPSHLAAVRFAELVRERTNGEIVIEVFPAGQLGNVGELIQSVSLGTLDLTAGLHAGVAADFVKDFGVLNAGYLVDDYEQFRRVAESEFYQNLREEFIREGGIRILAVTLLGTLHVTANRPILDPDDMQGVKLRSLGDPVLMANTRGLGAVPTPMAFGELYGGLQTGIVDGQSNPIPTVSAMKFYEVQSHLILTGHQMMFNQTMINEGVYQSLPAEYQKIILEAAEEAASYNDQLILEQDESLRLELTSAGMTIIGSAEGLNLDAFRASMREEMLAHEAEGGWSDGLYDQVGRYARGQ